MSIRVLLADDLSTVQQGLLMFLALDEVLDVVGGAANDIETFEYARQLNPDVVLIDILMPEMDDIADSEAI